MWKKSFLHILLAPTEAGLVVWLHIDPLAENGDKNS